MTHWKLNNSFLIVERLYMKLLLCFLMKIVDVALLSLLVLLHNTLLEDSRALLLLAVTEGDLLSSLALLIFFVSSEVLESAKGGMSA